MQVVGFNPNVVHTTAQFAAGQVTTDKDGKKYKYFRYKEATAAVDGVAGEVAYYHAPSGASAGATTDVTSDLSDSSEVGAGVLQVAMSDDEWGWFQIKGPATLSIALTGGADGDPLGPNGATDGTLDVADAATDTICAYAIDADANIILCDFPE